MLPDIPEGGGAEHGVHQRMQRDVRVTVAEEAAFPRDFHAAEHQFPVLRQAVHVISGADPQGGQAMIEQLFGSHIILRGGQFDIPDGAGNDPYLGAGKLHDGCVVGHLQPARHGLQRRAEQVRAGEPLRRLDFIEGGAGQGPRDPALLIAQLEGADGGNRGHAGSGRDAGRDDPADQVRLDEAAGRVVHQHEVLRIPQNRL